MAAMPDQLPTNGRRSKRRWRRFGRWLRFSLRTLLVLVTIFSVWLGVLSYRVQKMNLAIAAIRAAHGGISYECKYGVGNGNRSAQAPPGPDWLRELVGVGFFVDVYTVDFRYIHVRPEQLLPLQSFPCLQQLNLCETPQKDLSPLANLTTLTWLNLYLTSVDDDQVRHLANLAELTDLNLSRTPISDAGLVHLSKLHKLESLGLANTKISDKGLLHLCGLTRLKRLNLSGTQVTEEATRLFQQTLPNCVVVLDD
jgi:Leucine-rich repeat (LRR) protein